MIEITLGFKATYELWERFLIKRISVTTAALVLIAVFTACTSDDDTPLGSEFIGDLLGSEPGTAFQDTIPITYGDSVLPFYYLIENLGTMDLGRKNGYDRVMVLKADFSNPGLDTSKVVQSADFRIRIADTSENRIIKAVFYSLGTSYTEGDTISTLDTLAVIIPPGAASPVRTMQQFPRDYPLPPDLVQDWIRGDVLHNGIGIIFTELPSDTASIKFYSSETPTSSNRPTIRTFFAGGDTTVYKISDDGTLVRPNTTTPNLIISGGFARRIYFPVDLSQVNDSAAVHYAAVTFNFVPGTTFGADQSVLLYVPDSADPNDAGILNGQLVAEATLDSELGKLEMPLTNVLLSILADNVPDNGFILRFVSETKEVKQAAFYPSSNDSLRPRVVLTYSTPAEFDR